MISIVIPLYNKEGQIRNTLLSVLKQTFQNFEVVVVNDGSTDSSVAIVKRFNDSRIRLIEQPNRGVSAARNRGIEEARFDYVALLDADDEWKPAYLESQLNLIRSFPQCSVFACAYELKQGDKTKPIILNKIPFAGEKGMLSNYFEVASCSHPPICSTNIVVKKEALSAVGGFPEGVASGEDLLTWARLAVRSKIAYSLNTNAVFVIPPDLSHRTNRLNLDEKERIQAQLFALMDEASSEKMKRDIERYIGRWNEMTASSLLRSGRGRASLKYTIRALRHKGFELKLLFFILFSIIPVPFQKRIM